jgi:AcrR family transcriptional regulator
VRVLSRDGAKSLAQPQIAKEAGVPQGHLTYYFPKKIDLVRGVADHMRSLIVQELGPILAQHSGGTLREKFVAIASRVAQNRGRTRILLALLVEMEHDPGLRDELQGRVEALRALFATLMEREADDPDVSVVVAAAWGLGLQHLILEGRRSDAETERLFQRLLDWMDHLPPKRP